MPLNLSDADLAALAMACRSAAHHANGRPYVSKKGAQPSMVVRPEQFIDLAERLEAARAAQAQVILAEFRKGR